LSHNLNIRLPDGRRFAYAEFGDPAGVPVLYFHGAPSSRLEPLLIGDERIRASGLRLIAPDRPGMGGSDYQPGRRFADWPADVQALADALGLARFAVVGNSGGAAYAAICAARLASRVTAAVIVSGGWRMDWPEATRGLPFPNRLVMLLARRAPWLLGLLLKAMGGVASGERDKELAQMKARMPAADYAVFALPGTLEAFGAGIRECLAQGTRGAVHDLKLYVRDFGFDPGEIALPLAWFHGEQDVNAPIALARRASALIPGAKLVTFPDDAHLSTLVRHWEAVAVALKAT
jgi:pimeloyl-ACP methyl ester carboxylesterase